MEDAKLTTLEKRRRGENSRSYREGKAFKKIISAQGWFSLWNKLDKETIHADTVDKFKIYISKFGY